MPKAVDAPAGAQSVQSVERAMAILEQLASAGECGVTEVAAALGVHKSTAFRLLFTLERGRLVEQSAERGKYRLGLGLVRLAGATTARLDLVRQARGVCRELAASTGETVNIAVLSGMSALYLDQAAGTSALQPHNWVGQHIPLHATSNGKVLLSGLSDDDLARTVTSLPAYTSATITRRRSLQRALDEVRARGYAVAVDELEVGLSAMAAPVYDAHGEVAASLSISGPTFRLDTARMHALLPQLLEAAADVSHRLGAPPAGEGHSLRMA